MSKPDPVDREEVLRIIRRLDGLDGAYDEHIRRIRALPSLPPSPLDLAARELAEAVRPVRVSTSTGAPYLVCPVCAVEWERLESHRDDCALARYREIREGEE